MKIFFLSLPFEVKNSGDYDYCTTFVQILNETEDIEAEYITTDQLSQLTDVKNQVKELSKIIKSKNNGGEDFYSSLAHFYQDQIRIDIAQAILKYLIDNRSPQKNILNLQLRPPESGFILAEQDLTTLKTHNFKICITCHEYKLNFNRRWMQSIMHPYFQRADLVIFFNKKDMSNACKHANHSVFLDRILLTPISKKDVKLLLHGFPKQSHTSLKIISQDEKVNLFLDKQELTSLECDMLTGQLSSFKGAPIRYKDINGVIKSSHEFKLEWGVREAIRILPTHGRKFQVSGIIINPYITEEIKNIKNTSSQTYIFKHDPYDLQSISKLSRVPPTAINIKAIKDYRSNIEFFNSKAPNIIIFGLIRAGKGYNAAIEIIKDIHYNYEVKLPLTRLIIVGNIGDTESLNLLAEIINVKFNCHGLINAATLTLADSLSEEDLCQIANETALKILSYRLEKIQHKNEEIKKALLKIGVYTHGIEETILNKNKTEISTRSKLQPVKINNPTNLQKFILKLEEAIPEALPIDIFLDIPTEELPLIFTQAKYAIKFDEKGWANNASGLINLLSFGCILYTNWGLCTGKKVTDENSFRGAIVLPKTKYCLKEGEKLAPEEEEEKKRICFTTDQRMPEKQNLITSKIIIDDIIAREENDPDYCSKFLISNGNNKKTLERAASLLESMFDPANIADQMTTYFESLFKPSSDRKILGSEEAERSDSEF